jgi:tRNA (cmo5U34)-methyltransferase
MSEDEGERVCYSTTDGTGRWWRRTWKRQCPEQGLALWGNRCQGVEGHRGVHWFFAPDGSFIYADNESDSTEEGCCGGIPPGHQYYRTPQEMRPYYHGSQYEDVEVTEPAELARLERGDWHLGESVIRPCSSEEGAKFRAAESAREREPRSPTVG